MEAYSYTYPQEEEKKAKQLPSFLTSLHSVRKVPTKPMKKPIAPFPPTPPKIYSVDPVNFKEVVQKLTGAAPEFHHQEVVPPALGLLSTTTTDVGPRRPPIVYPSVKMPSTEEVLYNDHMGETEEGKSFGAVGLSFSPSSLAWYSSLFPSPRTLSSLASSRL
ncbi:unnamed protein product [Fraxinus pennsylvanica]|uniref:VQ domain-containing protein n=1 Tax=Fraxinus pennsylvanica TaxID=56036 RepID=A0AAD2DU07_9LAMI|nr:unnamed protein product [Fraxinus pennsylvanica]